MFEKYNNINYSQYLEFAHCKICNPIKKSLLGKIKLKYKHTYNNLRQKDSIYISANNFNKIEKQIFSLFDCDVYHPNGIISGIDFFGINYYTKEKTIEIYNVLLKKQIDENLLSFLRENIDKYNGFYILGI